MALVRRPKREKAMGRGREVTESKLFYPIGVLVRIVDV